MITLTDMFCGCGGSSAGAINVPGVSVEYALNHWKLAIDSHNTNHPDTHHDCADISQTHPGRYNHTTGLIASPECTNHSLAKGQKRKNLNQQDIFQDKEFDPSAHRSRATMWDVPNFAEYHKYEFVIVENVVDVRMWVMFDPWLKAMHALGYLHECVYLNAMFAHDMSGNSFAPQSRDRIYIVFWKKGNKKPDLDIRPKAPCAKCGTVEAIQTWKPNRRAGKYKTQYTYRCSVCNTPVVPFYYAALNALDLSLPMVRIGDREGLGKKPLSVNTRARIQYGLNKFGYVPTILDQRNRFERKEGTRIRLAETAPLNTQSTQFSSYLFAPYMFNMSFSHSQSDKTYGLGGTFPTQTTQESMAMVSPEPYLLANRDCSPPKGLTDVMHTQTTALQEMLLAPPGSFLAVHRNNSNSVRLTDPLPTQSTAITNSLIVPIHGTAKAKPTTEPSDTVMTTGHSSLIILPYHGGSQQANQVTQPVTTVAGNDGISLVDAKPEIDDCYFRMLQPKETALAQGFPTDYIILGNKSDQQKQIGNANPPPTMELLVSRCVQSLL